MLNLHESIRANPGLNKLEVGGLLFAEYTCPIAEERLATFADTDYLVHVLSGRKTWHTIDGAWTARGGDTLFFRKGAAIVQQYFDQDFCLMLFFLPDSLIRDTVKETPPATRAEAPGAEPPQCACRVVSDVGLSAFFQSMRAYFSGRERPSEALVRLKVKELIVSLLTGGRNPQVASYFRSLEHRHAPSVREIMEANFRFNLSLDEYAQLCHRSLSSFKREFQRHFDEAPGRWLLRRRLDYAAALLQRTDHPVTEIVFESGFEDVSHFSRVFKTRFQASPTAYRGVALRAD